MRDKLSNGAFSIVIPLEKTVYVEIADIYYVGEFT